MGPRIGVNLCYVPGQHAERDKMERSDDMIVYDSFVHSLLFIYK